MLSSQLWLTSAKACVYTYCRHYFQDFPYLYKKKKKKININAGLLALKRTKQEVEVCVVKKKFKEEWIIRIAGVVCSSVKVSFWANETNIQTWQPEWRAAYHVQKLIWEEDKKDCIAKIKNSK